MISLKILFPESFALAIKETTASAGWSPGALREKCREVVAASRARTRCKTLTRTQPLKYIFSQTTFVVGSVMFCKQNKSREGRGRATNQKFTVPAVWEAHLGKLLRTTGSALLTWGSFWCFLEPSRPKPDDHRKRFAHLGKLLAPSGASSDGT